MDDFAREAVRGWASTLVPPRPRLRETLGRALVRYALGLAALADLLRGPR